MLPTSDFNETAQHTTRTAKKLLTSLLLTKKQINCQFSFNADNKLDTLTDQLKSLFGVIAFVRQQIVIFYRLHTADSE